MNSAAIGGGTPLEASLNAVLIYEDFILAAQANGALRRSTQLSGEAMQLNVKPWRLDMLKLPPMAAEAFAEAADAHLIVLALRQRESIPAWLINWLEQWARRRQFQDAVLVVRDGGNADTLPTRARSKLAQFAARHGLNFIFHHGGPTEEGLAPFARHGQGREPAQTSPLPHLQVRGPHERREGRNITE